MVFSINGHQAPCLMARHFSHAVLAESLAAVFFDGWYKIDPLLTELLASSPGTVTLRRLAEVPRDMDAAYRRIFFGTPGLLAKTTLLASGRDLRLFICFYQTGAPTTPPDPGLSKLVGRLALLHFERQIQTGVPALLMYSAPASVVTYRKRAYTKLGISSRASLFAICQTQQPPSTPASKAFKAAPNARPSNCPTRQ